MLIAKIKERKVEWLVKGVVGIATLVLCYVVMIQPVFSDIMILRQEIGDSQYRSDLFLQTKSLNESLSVLEKDLAVLTDRSLLLGKISDVAGQTQVDFNTLTPRTEREADYTRLKIDAEGKGAFLSLLKFLEAIEKVSASIKVRDFFLLNKLAESTSQSKYSLQIHLVFETFLRQPGKKKNV